MKLCSRRLMVFVEIYVKNVKFGYLNPILKRGGAQRWSMARWKAHGRLFIRVN